MAKGRGCTPVLSDNSLWVVGCYPNLSVDWELGMGTEMSGRFLNAELNTRRRREKFITWTIKPGQ